MVSKRNYRINLLMNSIKMCKLLMLTCQIIPIYKNNKQFNSKILMFKINRLKKFKNAINSPLNNSNKSKQIFNSKLLIKLHNMLLIKI
jgi:hypothetical protein